MRRPKTSSIVLLLMTGPPLMLCCHREDSVQERLELTISDYETTVLPRELWQDRHDQVLAGLRKLRGKTLSAPVVLWATRFCRRGARGAALTIDYADLRPRVAFVRVYVGDEMSMDLAQSPEYNASEAEYAGARILYTCSFLFEQSDPPPLFWAEEDVFAEIHNVTGEVSARFPVRRTLAASATTSAPASTTTAPASVSDVNPLWEGPKATASRSAR